MLHQQTPIVWSTANVYISMGFTDVPYRSSFSRGSDELKKFLNFSPMSEKKNWFETCDVCIFPESDVIKYCS